MKETKAQGAENQFTAALILLAVTCLALFTLRFIATGTTRYWFLIWNLLLAIMPFCFAMLLGVNLIKERWMTWKNITLTILWLGFLPNSFYLISDLIHLRSTGEISVLFDAVFIFSFVICGLVYGLLSVYLVHRQLLKRLTPAKSSLLIGGVLLMSSFAIYLGRYLRWNSWDVAVNPAGLIYDVSDKIINPVSNIQTFGITLTFFIVLSSTYFFAFSAVNYIGKGRI